MKVTAHIQKTIQESAYEPFVVGLTVEDEVPEDRDSNRFYEDLMCDVEDAVDKQMARRIKNLRG